MFFAAFECIHPRFAFICNSLPCCIWYLTLTSLLSGWILSRWTVNGRFTSLLNALTSSADITLLLTAVCHHACKYVAAVCSECFIGMQGIRWRIYLHNGRSFMAGFIGDNSTPLTEVSWLSASTTSCMTKNRRTFEVIESQLWFHMQSLDHIALCIRSDVLCYRAW